MNWEISICSYCNNKFHRVVLREVELTSSQYASGSTRKKYCQRLEKQWERDAEEVYPWFNPAMIGEDRKVNDDENRDTVSTKQTNPTSSIQLFIQWHSLFNTNFNNLHRPITHPSSFLFIRALIPIHSSTSRLADRVTPPDLRAATTTTKSLSCSGVREV